jgi:hypothetical protein
VAAICCIPPTRSATVEGFGNFGRNEWTGESCEAVKEAPDRANQFPIKLNCDASAINFIDNLTASNGKKSRGKN